MSSKGIELHSVEDAYRFAKLVAKTEFCPRGMSVEGAAVAMIYGLRLGLDPLQSLQNVAVINGKPSLYGPAALAVVQRHPDYEWHKAEFNGEGDDYGCLFTIKRKGSEPSTTRFNVSDARKARLWSKSGPWSDYPNRMLYHRAKGFALDDTFPDALHGLITQEAAQDWPQKGPPVEVEIRAEPPSGSKETPIDLSLVSNETPEDNEPGILNAVPDPLPGTPEERKKALDFYQHPGLPPDHPDQPVDEQEAIRSGELDRSRDLEIQQTAQQDYESALKARKKTFEEKASAMIGQSSGESRKPEVVDPFTGKSVDDPLEQEIWDLVNRLKARGMDPNKFLEKHPSDYPQMQKRVIIKEIKRALKPRKKA